MSIIRSKMIPGMTALFSCALLSAQPPFPPSASPQQLLDTAYVAGSRGFEAEQSGRLQEALQHYANAVRYAEDSLGGADFQRIPFEFRPPGAYYVLGRARLDSARIIIQLRANSPEVETNLSEAEHAFADTLKLDRIFASSMGRQWTPDAWKIFYALGNVDYLQGNLTRARQEYQTVINQNPQFPPARDGQVSIDYLQERGNSRVGAPPPETPSGVKLGKKPEGVLTTDRIRQYAVEVMKLWMPRWGNLVAMLSEDLTKFAGQK